MSFEIKINEDQTVTYVSKFKKGRSSLSAMGAASLVEKLNKLDRKEMIACVLAVKSRPFPFGAEREVLKKALEQLNASDWENTAAASTKFSDGDIRRELVLRWCAGCNAPGDSYVRAMVEMKEETR